MHNRFSGRRAMFVLASAVTSAVASSAKADTTWLNTGGDGLWPQDFNWSNSQPSSGDIAYFDPSGLANGNAVDLGGGTVSAGSIVFSSLVSSSYSFSNGTLMVDAVTAPPGSAPTFTSSSTITSATRSYLKLNAANLEIDGTISDTILPGGTTIEFPDGGTLYIPPGEPIPDFPFPVTVTTNIIPTSVSVWYASTTRILGTSTYTGVSSFTGGNGIIGGANGSLASSSGYEVFNTDLQLDNSAGVNSNRLSDTATVGLHFGSLDFIATTADNGDETETIGQLKLEEGDNHLNLYLGFGTGNKNLTFNSLTRTNGATLALSIGDSSGNQRNGTVHDLTDPGQLGGGGLAGSTNQSVVPFVFYHYINGSSFDESLVTRDAATGQLRPLDPNTEYVHTIASGTATSDNVRITGDHFVTDDTTINAIVMGDSTVHIADGKTLTLGAGVAQIALTQYDNQPTAFTGGSVSFDGHDAELNVDRFSAVVDSQIVNASTLIKSGDGQLVLTRANSFTGGVRLNGGSIISQTTGALGSGDVVYTGPFQELFFTTRNQTLTNDIVLPFAENFTNLDVSQPRLIGQLYVDAGVTVTHTGALSGTGTLLENGDGVLKLEGNSFNTNRFELGAVNVVMDGAFGDSGSINTLGVSRSLSGTGRVYGYILAGGATVTPGHGAGGQLTTDYANLTASTLHIDLAGADPSSYGQLVATQYVNLSSATLEVAVETSPTLSEVFIIIDNGTRV